jgi:hypothetical protein
MKSIILCFVVLVTLLDPCRAETIYGLTNFQELVTFDSGTRNVTASTPLSGFSLQGEILLSIDIRPATGELYGYSNQNNLYKINPVTGGRAQVGGTLSVLPIGAYKSIDFNPTVDRIRLLGSGAAPNNLRVHPDTGAIVMTDGTLAFQSGDVNNGDTPVVVNGAYTNSFPGATSTVLYDLEAGNDVLVTQTPANDGTLQTRGPIGFNLTTGGGFTGFDISRATGNAYLVGNNLVGGGLTANSLYQVNLATGAASLLGPVAGTNGSFRDIAVANVIPEPVSIALLLCAVVISPRRLC